MFIVIDNEWQDDVPEIEVKAAPPLHYDVQEAIAWVTARQNARIDYWNSLTEEEQESLLDEGYDAPDIDIDEETDF